MEKTQFKSLYTQEKGDFVGTECPICFSKKEKACFVQLSCHKHLICEECLVNQMKSFFDSLTDLDNKEDCFKCHSCRKCSCSTLINPKAPFDFIKLLEDGMEQCIDKEPVNAVLLLLAHRNFNTIRQRYFMLNILKNLPDLDIKCLKKINQITEKCEYSSDYPYAEFEDIIDDPHQKSNALE